VASIIEADIVGGKDEPTSTSGGGFTLVDFTNATISQDGNRECVNTTGIMETYDKRPIYQCFHRNEEQCHYTYVTQFEPTKEEVCEENYEKNCKVQNTKNRAKRRWSEANISDNILTTRIHSNCFRIKAKQLSDATVLKHLPAIQLLGFFAWIFLGYVQQSGYKRDS
jgi:hypothetical protein